ncbi:MAG: polyketide antibiotic transporter [Chloroflexota bacterium]|nr:polyketide antibiotic transporter [Chloroflexota bacterium]
MTTLLGFVAARLPIASSAYLALAIVVVAPVYAAVGIVASQCVPTSRGALQLAGGVLGLDFALRVIADTAGFDALQWVMPLGWVEELRPFAGSRPAVLILPVAVTLVLLVAGLMLEVRRDVGTAVFSPNDVVRTPATRSLGSPMLLFLRSQITSVSVWTSAIAVFAFIVGTISKNIASGLSENIKEQFDKIGVKIATPSGYIGLTFLFFILVIALFCCSQLAAMREDEAEGRLETLFALPQSRLSWFVGRLALAVASATLLGLAAGIGAGLGATVVRANVSFLGLIGAGLNTLPTSVLFLGIGALFVSTAPRTGVGAAYAVVCFSFVWELVGALLNVPTWFLSASPFHQVGLVPAAPFRPISATVMIVVGLFCASLALARFRMRDLVGA